MLSECFRNKQCFRKFNGTYIHIYIEQFHSEPQVAILKTKWLLGTKLAWRSMESAASFSILDLICSRKTQIFAEIEQIEYEENCRLIGFDPIRIILFKPVGFIYVVKSLLAFCCNMYKNSPLQIFCLCYMYNQITELILFYHLKLYNL